MNIALINLSNPENLKKDNAIKLLSVLLSQEIIATEKKRVLKDNFKIPMTTEIEEGVNYMCNLSDGVERRGMEKGMEKATGNMVLELIKAKQPLSLIMQVSKYSAERIAEIGKRNGIPLID
ncbi:MAG: hypothetical protein IKN43_12710 [Selenomonadaceae bacterium]|nr:hypothetical protein [Selenomonadaceae bacterium]